MANKIVEYTLTAALAAAGTFAISYPAGTSKGNFSGSLKHKVATESGNIFTSPLYFTLSYSATQITVTWASGAPTLPANTKLLIELDMPGVAVDRVKFPLDPAPEFANRASLHVINFGSPATADADGVCVSQSVAEDASAVIDGVLLSGGKAVFDVPRNVVAAWTTNAVLTFTGKDAYGNTMIEASAGGTASHTGAKAFKEITSVSSDTAITGLTVGTGKKLGLPFYISRPEQVVSELEDGYNLKPPSTVYIPFEIEQTELLAATAEQIVSPVAGYIKRARGIIQGAVTTGGAITFEVNTVAVVGLTFTILDAATAGTRYADVPTTARSATTLVAAGDQLTVTPGAAIDTAGQLNGMLEIEPLGYTGTLVVGSTVKPTATTGDVRGTYQPAADPDGTTAFELVVRLQDPDFLGQDQYAG